MKEKMPIEKKVVLDIILDTPSEHNTISIAVGLVGDDEKDFDTFAFALKDEISKTRSKYITFEDIFKKKWLIDKEKIMAISMAIRKKEA